MADPLFTSTFMTHGGFEMVRDAWNFVSVIMNSNEYRVLVTAVFVLSLVFSAMFGTIASFLRGANPLGWLVTGLLAVMVYTSIVQTGLGNWNLRGAIAIYDDVKNMNQVITDLPPGLVLFAGAINRIEVGLEKLVWNALTGTEDITQSSVYDMMAVKLLGSYDDEVMSIVHMLIPAQVHRSLQKFYDDVWSYELAHTVGAAQEFLETATDPVEVMKNYANPALFTVTWLDNRGNPVNTSQVVNGQEAINRLSSFFNSNDWRNVANKICRQFFFDAANLPSRQACYDIFQHAFSKYVGVNTDLPHGIVYSYIASEWNRYLATLGATEPASAAGLESRIVTTLAYNAVANAAARWIPNIKIVYQVLLISLTPFLILMLVTLGYMNALKMLIGLYIWFVCWTVVDAVILGTWVKHAVHTFSMVSATGHFGANVIPQFKLLANKTLAVLGGMRFAGFTLSALLSYGLTGWGGAAFVETARSMLGSGAVAVGSRASEVALNPDAGYVRQKALAQEQTGEAFQYIGAGALQTFISGMGIAAQKLATGNAYAEYAPLLGDSAKGQVAKSTMEGLYFSTVSPESFYRIMQAEYGAKVDYTQALEKLAAKTGLDISRLSAVRNQDLALGSLGQAGQELIKEGFGKDAASSLTTLFRKGYIQKGHLVLDKEGNITAMTVEVDSARATQLRELASYEEKHGRSFNAQGLRRLAEEIEKTGGTAKVVLGGGNKGLATIEVQAGGRTYIFDTTNEIAKFQKDSIETRKIMGVEIAGHEYALYDREGKVAVKGFEAQLGVEQVKELAKAFEKEGDINRAKAWEKTAEAMERTGTEKIWARIQLDDENNIVNAVLSADVKGDVGYFVKDTAFAEHLLGESTKLVDRFEIDFMQGYSGDLSAAAYYTGKYTGKAYKISRLAAENEQFDKTTALQDAQWMSRQVDPALSMSKVTGWGLNFFVFKIGETKSRQIAQHLHVKYVRVFKKNG